MNNKPDIYETDVVINDQIVHIRPITQFDAWVEKLSDSKVDELSDIDYDSKMAFVAVPKNSDAEQGIGICLYITDEYDHCDATLIVQDDWQEHGLGQILMKQLIDFARTKGKELFYSIESAENTFMLIVARDLGMNSQRDPEDATIVRHEMVL